MISYLPFSFHFFSIVFLMIQYLGEEKKNTTVAHYLVWEKEGIHEKDQYQYWYRQ